jgi:hypothetical protein
MGNVASRPTKPNVSVIDVGVMDAGMMDGATAEVAGFVPQRGIWVQLRNRPSDYAADCALLVCPVEEDVWIAWVPDYGEMVLPRSQFYRMGESVA